MRPGSRLALLRHAKSDWPDDLQTHDRDRPLSAKGRRSIALVADHVAASGLAPDLVLCSSALRTRETVEHLAAALPRNVPVLVEDRLYLAEPNDLLARLRELDEGVPTVLLVGHNPGIHALALGLLVPADRARLPTYPTAALTVHEPAVPRWSELGPATTRLVEYVTPRSLREAAGQPGED